MAGRRRSIRFRLLTILLVPVVSLVAIWGFAATVTVSRGLDLLRVSKVFDNVVMPLRSLISSLQQERLLSLVVLGNRHGSLAESAQLHQQRAQTNQALANLERLALENSNLTCRTADARWRLHG